MESRGSLARTKLVPVKGRLQEGNLGSQEQSSQFSPGKGVPDFMYRLDSDCPMRFCLYL